MEVADSFIPTGGAVGLLPMVTYFLLVVTTFAFSSLFIVGFISLLPVLRADHPVSQWSIRLLPVVAAVASISYYIIQAYYHKVLSELVTVTDGNDRQTLIRESFHALSQYRYMLLFIVTPIVLVQLFSLIKEPPKLANRFVGGLLLSSAFFFFFQFIGQQSLSFDNEIQTGPMVGWGIASLGLLVFLLLMINRFRQGLSGESEAMVNVTAPLVIAPWIVYSIGYWLTLVDFDFNWLQIIFTLADLTSLVGVSAALYRAKLT